MAYWISTFHSAYRGCDVHIFGREKQEDSCSNLKRENSEWMWAVTEVVVCILHMHMRGGCSTAACD